MTIKLAEDQLPKALEHLKSFKPAADTLKMGGLLDSEIYHPFGQTFYVDQWPDFDIILSVVDKDAKIKQHPSFSFATKTDSSERIKSILEDVIAPLQNEDPYCEGVPTKFLGILEEFAEGWNTQYIVNDTSYILVTDMDHLKLHQLPDGYTTGSLTLEDAETIASMWEYTAGETTLLMTKYDIASRPSVAIRTTDEKLVGWEVMHYWISPGMLKVLPEHRRKGLAKVMVSALAKKVLDEGHVMYVHALKTNTESINLHKKCGFWIMEGTDAHWGHFESKRSHNGNKCKENKQ